MRILIATTNSHKLREIQRLLTGVDVSLLSLADLPRVEEPEETGVTFEENARLKARFYDAYARATAGPDALPTLTVAEDSGLDVDALGGDPGIYSARFVRPDATYPERFAEIYRRLGEARAPKPWTARFVCALSAVAAERPVFEVRETVEGEIADQPSGRAGFGYDPIFFFREYGSTLADVDEERKLRVAHRGKAFRALARWLSEPHPY